MNKEEKNLLNGVELRYTELAVLFIVLQLLIELLFIALLPEWTESHLAVLSFIAVIVGYYLIAFPILCRRMKRFPKILPERSAMTPGRFLTGVLLCFGIAQIGSLIGNLLHQLLSSVAGGESAGIDTLLRDMPIGMAILVTGVLAPVFEELTFRKLLLDATAARLGKFTAILLSGLMFGLFHGNFQQLFYAAGLGAFFAWIYLDTGNILYPILYHMIVNLTSSAVTLPLTVRFEASEVGQALLYGNVLPSEQLILDNLGMLLGYFGWVLFLGAVSLAGIIVLILKLNRYQKKKRLTGTRPIAAEHPGRIFRSWGLWLFIAVSLVLFAISYFL